MFKFLMRLFARPEPLFPEDLRGSYVGPVPRVDRSEVDRWVQRYKSEGARYILVIFEHNLFDDIREVYPYPARDLPQVCRRIALVEDGMDASWLQIIDLHENIDRQLADAPFIERTDRVNIQQH